MDLGRIQPRRQEETVAVAECGLVILKFPRIRVGWIAPFGHGENLHEAIAGKHHIPPQDFRREFRILLHDDVESAWIIGHAAGVAHRDDAFVIPCSRRNVVEGRLVHTWVAGPIVMEVAISPFNDRLEEHGVAHAKCGVETIHHQRVGLIGDVEFEIAGQPATIAGRKVQDLHDHGLCAFRNAVLESIQGELLGRHEGREVHRIWQLGEIDAVRCRARTVVDDDHLLDVDDGLDGAGERQHGLTTILVDDVGIRSSNVNGEVHLHHRIGLERSRLQDHEGLECRIRTVRDGQADVVRFSTFHHTLRRKLDGIPVLAQDIMWVRIVDVVRSIGDVVHRADRDGQLRIAARNLSEVDGIVSVRTIDARTAQEESEDVIVLRVDPPQILIGTEDIIESDGVPRSDEIEFNRTDVIDAGNTEVLAYERRYAVGNGQQIGVSGYFEAIVYEIVLATIVDVGGVVGHLRGQDEASGNRKVIGVETRNLPDLNRASRELDVRGLHPCAQQNIVDVFIRGQGAVHLQLGGNRWRQAQTHGEQQDSRDQGHDGLHGFDHG